jgi:hypothetical protein
MKYVRPVGPSVKVPHGEVPLENHLTGLQGAEGGFFMCLDESLGYIIPPVLDDNGFMLSVIS